MGAIYGTGSATGSRYMGSRAHHGLMSQVAQCMGTGTAYQVVRNTNTVTAVKLQSMDKLMQASGTVHPLTNSRDALAGEGHLAGNFEFLIVQAGMGIHLDHQQSQLSCSSHAASLFRLMPCYAYMACYVQQYMQDALTK